MNDDKILSYLTDLSAHNDREWFRAHKAEYEEANARFEALVGELLRRLGDTDEGLLRREPKELTYKLMRDTLFSVDKSPYLPAFRAHLSSGGKQPVPVGYYLMIMPFVRSFLGGGLFCDVFKGATEMVRGYIAAHSDEWSRIIGDEEFCASFAVKGTALKKVPAGYAPEHPQAEYLKHKSWYLEYPVSDDQVRKTDYFLGLAETIFRKMKPFNDFLNRALSKFEMPQR